MTTWSGIYGGAVDGDPVVAPTHPFRHAGLEASRTGRDVREVARAFALMEAGSSPGFRGRAARAMQNPMTEVLERLDPVEEVFEHIGNVLRAHADELQRLHSQAEHALGRAAAAFRLKHAAERRRSEAASREATAAGETAEADRTLWTIRAQLADVAATPDGELRRAALEDREDQWQARRYAALDDERRAGRARSEADADVRAAEERLEYWRAGAHPRSWVRLRAREEELNGQTAGALRSIDLAGLADPGFLEQVAATVSQWTAETFAALASGDWGKALHAIRDILEVAGFVLFIAGLVAGGPLAVVAFGVAVAHFGLTVGLFAGGVEHHRTGRTLGVEDVLLSGAGVVMGGLGLRAAKAGTVLRTAKISKLSEMARKPVLGALLRNEGLRTFVSTSDTAAGLIGAATNAQAFGTKVGHHAVRTENPDPLVTMVSPRREILSPDEIVRRQRHAVQLAPPSDLRHDVKPRLCSVGAGASR